MRAVICVLFAFVSALFRSRLALQLEIVALRHQLNVYQRTAKRPRIKPEDRIFSAGLCASMSRSIPPPGGLHHHYERVAA